MRVRGVHPLKRREIGKKKKREQSNVDENERLSNITCRHKFK
jgi:hypothetical protein